jgi:hypothetical protein
MKFIRALNEYSKSYKISDIKKLARPNSNKIEISYESFKTKDGSIVKYIIDEIDSGKYKYRFTFIKQNEDGTWEKAGNPIKSNSYASLADKASNIEKSDVVGRKIEIDGTKLGTRIKAFIADYIGISLKALEKEIREI